MEAAFAALFDPLYCPEEHLDLYREELGEDAGEHWPDQHPAPLDDELPELFEALRAKEGVVVAGDGEEDGYGGAAGREAAVGWAYRAAARLGFSALTAALAAAYLDRCFLAGGALRLGDQPWMSRLAAIACVALAAKVEETRVPLLLDIQLCAAAGADPADAYVFEAKTVGRMELLVLSALGWRMHPVTPFSYLQPLLADAAMRLNNCEGVLLAVIAGTGICATKIQSLLHFHAKGLVFYSATLCEMWQIGGGHGTGPRRGPPPRCSPPPAMATMTRSSWRSSMPPRSAKRNAIA